MKKFIIVLLAMSAISSPASRKVEVDDYIKQREDFVCSNKKIKNKFDTLIREEFKTASTLEGNQRTLESLQGLIDDHQTIAEIQTALIVGPALGLMAFAAVSTTATIGIVEVMATSIPLQALDAGALAGLTMFGLMSSASAYYSANAFLEAPLEENLNAATIRITEIDQKIKEIQADTPELLVDEKDTVDYLMNKYIGAVGHNRYQKIANQTIFINNLLTIKLRDLLLLKANTVELCN